MSSEVSGSLLFAGYDIFAGFMAMLENLMTSRSGEVLLVSLSRMEGGAKALDGHPKKMDNSFLSEFWIAQHHRDELVSLL